MHKRILLSFHPLAWTAFCAGQMKSPEDKRDVFSALNTIAVGSSVDSVPGKKVWADTPGITLTPWCAISGLIGWWLSSAG